MVQKSLLVEYGWSMGGNVQMVEDMGRVGVTASRKNLKKGVEGVKI